LETDPLAKKKRTHQKEIVGPGAGEKVQHNTLPNLSSGGWKIIRCNGRNRRGEKGATSTPSLKKKKVYVNGGFEDHRTMQTSGREWRPVTGRVFP